MERPAALIRAHRAFTAVAAVLAICAASPAPAGARWTRAVDISGSSSVDVLGPQIAASQAGAFAVSFNEVNMDFPATAAAFVALASPHGSFRTGRTAGPAVQEVLSLAFSGRTLELLTARSPVGLPCCTTVQVIRRQANGTLGRPHTIVSGVGGPAIGQLVPLANGNLLAVIAGPARLWVTEAVRTGRFARPRGLTRRGVAPVALAVTGTPGGGSTVAWTQGAGRSVISANGPAGAAPSRPHTVLTVPAGHEIDGLQLVPRADGLTIGWTESWNDASGAYHSRAMAADLPGRRRRVRARALSAAADVASGLSLATDGGDDQVAAWDVCSSDTCAVHASVRNAPRRWFRAASRLGRIDPGETPQVTSAPLGGSLAGWITGGRVVIAQLRPGASRFGHEHPISGDIAANLDLAFGPTGTAVATWTQGTFVTNVFATLSRRRQSRHSRPTRRHRP